MGLANLVPGISGGTMLLAAGVYPAFIAAIADVTTLRFRLRSLVLLGAVVGAAAIAIVLLAGVVRDLVIEQRWVMYSLFIGLTLGGLPLVWRLARPATPGLWAGAVGGFLVMLAMAFGPSADGAEGGASTVLLVLSGMAGAGAMILPGISGGYLLLLLGQYLPILGAVDKIKQALLASDGIDFTLLGEALTVAIPVGVGVVIGVVGISNGLRWLLAHHPKPTLGALLGLLLGAVAGLWPFQAGVAPEPGDVVRGEVLTAETAAAVDPEDWALARFDPSGGQAASALGLIVLGLGATLAIARLGGDEEADDDASAPG